MARSDCEATLRDISGRAVHDADWLQEAKGARGAGGQGDLQQDAVEVVCYKLCVPRSWEHDKPKSLIIRYADVR